MSGPKPVWRPWSTLSILADLAPSDFHLFRPMNYGLRGQHFPSNDAILRVVKQWAGADFDECGMQALVHCWRKCIANGGDQVKK
jgi:hypothetical protein